MEALIWIMLTAVVVIALIIGYGVFWVTGSGVLGLFAVLIATAGALLWMRY